ncbi:glycine zipper domain-containing protein [Streptomyces sp. OspMP-M45]|uniref:glycine zipper domain-containing protein n=1 Tax=Streptomyces sp. OspMP-M45 TaxID=1115570 RepID=UPI00350E57BC
MPLTTGPCFTDGAVADPEGAGEAEVDGLGLPGPVVGSVEGSFVGSLVGSSEGSFVGSWVGSFVGSWVGSGVTALTERVAGSSSAPSAYMLLKTSAPALVRVAGMSL